LFTLINDVRRELTNAHHLKHLTSCYRPDTLPGKLPSKLLGLLEMKASKRFCGEAASGLDIGEFISEPPRRP
jgi:hypothetical protein